jgi:hypothetical protein
VSALIEEVTGVEVGPVEYAIIRFQGSHFRAEIAPALAKLVETGTARIIDFVLILKYPDGKITTFEFDELAELAPFTLAGEAGGIVDAEEH